MKRTVTIAVLMTGCFLPAFAQRGAVVHHKLLPADSTLYQRALKNNQIANYTWKYDNSERKVNNPATNNPLLLPDLKGGNLNLAMNRPPEMEKMPCVKSLQKSRMPVSKPDSTLKHTLLIKKF
jgi:hypothetical protein